MSTAVAFKTGSSSGNFAHGGQNQYRPIRRRRRGGEDDNILEFSYLSKGEKRMGFEKCQDPAYLAFEHLDSLPLTTVIRETAKETWKDIQKIDLRTSIQSLMQRR